MNKNWKPFEREITRKLKKIGLEAKRNWSNQFIEKDTCDIVAVKRCLDEEKRYIFQLKHGKHPSLKEAYDQAVDGKEYTNDIPIGVCRFSQTRETVVIMNWKTFERLLKK